MMKILETTTDEMMKAVETSAALVLMLLDAEGNVRLSGRGIEKPALPSVLRQIADTLDPPKADQKMVLSAAIAICPACGDALMFPAELGLGAPGVVFANVCSCTAFLFALRTEGGGVRVELMTDEQFADLPQPVRHQMMHYRDARGQQRKQ